MEEVINILKENKKLRILIIVFIIVFILHLLVSYTNIFNKGYTKYKIDETKAFVYDRIINNSNNRVPFINVDTEEIKKLNDKILEDYNTFMTSSKNTYVYSSSKSSYYLSIIITKSKTDTEYLVNDISFEAYTIDLREQKLLSDTEIKEHFEVTDKQIEQKIEKQFKYFYEDEIKKGIIPSQECNYECFLSWRGFDNYLEDISFFIENGSLYVYKKFDIYSVYAEEEYYSYDDFRIFIK